MNRVKFSYEWSDGGEIVAIRKDGGFTDEEVTELLKAATNMGKGNRRGDSQEEEIEREVDEQTDKEVEADEQGNEGGGAEEAGNGKSQVAKSDTTPPAGRGVAAKELADGTQITKQGTIDRRTLRGTPENPDKEQQQFISNLQKKGAIPTPANQPSARH